MSRQHRAQIAQETVKALEAGQYVAPGGRVISIAAELAQCVQGTQLYSPERLQTLQKQLPPADAAEPARIEIANETTLAGITALTRTSASPVLALNFASARNPGGGFLGGSQAQEESLARSSGLYPSLQQAWPFYEQHRASRSSLYSDAMILSPDCPILRRDDGAWLEQPLQASFISCAAPNAGAIADSDEGSRQFREIPQILLRRARYMLVLAAARGYRHLVLGAWGCGVFRNEPAQVAHSFASLLRHEGFDRHFSTVRFSVLDPSPDRSIFKAFEQALAQTRIKHADQAP